MSDESKQATGVGESRESVLALFGQPMAAEDAGGSATETPAETPASKPDLALIAKGTRVLDTLNEDDSEGTAEDETGSGQEAGEAGAEEGADAGESAQDTQPVDAFAELKSIIAEQANQIQQLIALQTGKLTPTAPAAPPAPKPSSVELSDDEFQAAFDSKEGLQALLAKTAQKAREEALAEVPDLIKRRELEATSMTKRVEDWSKKPANKAFIDPASPYKKAFDAYVRRVEDQGAWVPEQIEAQLDVIAKTVKEHAALFDASTNTTPASGATLPARPRPTAAGGSSRPNTKPKAEDAVTRTKRLLGVL